MTRPAPIAADHTPLRILAVGAHPDDCELKVGGMALKWRAKGHAVKFVSFTNGDAGHHVEGGGALARRRIAETHACGRILGVETEVVDNHDGELMPTLENRRTLVRIIRNWRADIVISHRPNDYHPDHRYLAQLVQDAAFMVTVPMFEPATPRLERNPIFLYLHDHFRKPWAFEPDVVVGIDRVAERKYRALLEMPSQLAEWLPWIAGVSTQVPGDAAGLERYMRDWCRARDIEVAEKYRERLVEIYGKRRGEKIQTAEALEICEYGRQPGEEELRQLFGWPGSEPKA